MKVTVMLGNGFDISLGIKTSYGAFYDWYCPQESDQEHISKFRKEINDDICRDVPDEEKTWADFEIGLGNYTKKFDKDTVDLFLDCYEDAQEKMVEFLREKQDAFKVNNITDESITAFQNSICNFYNDVSDLEKLDIKPIQDKYRGEDCEISFVTFNYTYTMERILARISSKKLNQWNRNSYIFGYVLNKNVIHAHGTLDSFPVIGVNDTSQIENKDLLETPQFKEFMIKSENIVALGQLWHRKAEEQISNSKFICILGMSIGETDAKWWRKLVQWLKADDSRHIILYWHEKKAPNNIRSRSHLRCVNKAKEKLLSYSKLTVDETNALKKRIHVVINTQKFMKLETQKNGENCTGQKEEVLAAI